MNGRTVAAPALRQQDFRAMGSAMRAVVAADESVAALDAVPGWFAAWEACLSRFRDDSEISRLNDAPGRAVRVSHVLWSVLAAALDAAAWTEGLATPTVLDALERAGYDRSFERLPAEPRGRQFGRSGSNVAADGRGLPVARWRAVRLNAAHQTVTLPRGVRLDLGGIAKGWAADEAVRRLGAAAPALMDAGGDIAVSGPLPGGGGWPIAIGDPFAPEGRLAVLYLQYGGVATSGRDFRRWRQGGTWQHHLIDPRTGRPAVTDTLTATVVAPNARQAEAAAKVALILGRREGLAWIDAHPSLAALLVDVNGQTHPSRRLGAYLGG